MLSQEINIKDGTQSIVLTGRLEGIEALEFRQKVHAVIEHNIESFQLDVSAIESIDLTGFNAVVMLKKEVEGRGKKFQLKATKENAIQEYIHLSKLNLNQIEAAR